MEVTVNGEKVVIENVKKLDDTLSLSLDGKLYTFYSEDLNSFVTSLAKDNHYQVFLDSKEAEVVVIPKVTGKGTQVLSEGSLTSPLPGKVFKVIKNAGDKVVKGDAILIIEAMKMEHTIRAQKDGVVYKIFFKEGEQVDGGVNLVEIE